jgi:MoaA/NifB/PqqE/SkfB family radical SAM enzyme
MLAEYYGSRARQRMSSWWEMLRGHQPKDNWSDIPPKIVSMTMTSRCNLRCIMCDHAVRNVEKEDFDPALLDKIGDFIASADVVDLTGLGEPTLSALFWKILDRFPATEAKSARDFFLMFNTNAVALKDRDIERITRSRVGRIRISIDSPDAKTFYDIRATPLDNVVANARRLIDARNATGRKHPLIGVEMTVMRRNLGQMNAMVDLVKEIDADFVEFWSINELPPNQTEQWVIRRPGVEFSYRDELLSAVDTAELTAAVHESEEYAQRLSVGAAFIMLGKGSGTTLYPHSAARDVQVNWNSASIRCDLPWKEMRATYKGDVFACCWGPRPIGSLSDSTMAEIWNAPTIRAMRHDLLTGNVPEACKGAGCQVLAGLGGVAK